MSKANLLKGMLAIVLLFSVTACSVTEKEAISSATEAVQDNFQGKSLDSNHHGNGFSYYLPEGFKIESEKNNNILLKKGKHTYILFVNQLEKPNSQVVYETTKANKNVILNQTFRAGDRFGYVIVLDTYEISVGIGGVKMTAKSNKGSLAENAKIMMEIVNSVKYE